MGGLVRAFESTAVNTEIPLPYNPADHESGAHEIYIGRTYNKISGQYEAQFQIVDPTNKYAGSPFYPNEEQINQRVAELEAKAAAHPNSAWIASKLSAYLSARMDLDNSGNQTNALGPNPNCPPPPRPPVQTVTP